MPLDKRDYSIPKVKRSEHLSQNQSWKLIVRHMYHGGWMTIPELQGILRFRRSRLRAIINKMIEAGIMETKKELSFERTKGRSKWLPADASPDGKPKYKRRDGLLPRHYRYYRLILGKISIEVQKENPSK